MSFPHNLIIKQDINNEIKNIKDNLILECMEQRKNLNEEFSFNYEIQSKYTNYLYDILYQVSKDKLNNFNLKDINFKLWCFLTDKKFNKSCWHNHTKTSSINCVIYLNAQNKGIFFKYKDKEAYVLPEDNNMLIFPAFLDHCPETSKKEPRISLNLELRCHEPVEKIFNI